MTRTRRNLQLVVIVAALLVAGGCGGAEAPPATPGAVTPAPGATDGLAADAGATGEIDPLTGQPIDATAADAGTSATVPDLVGDDVSGGLAPVSGNTPLFDAQAVSTEDLKDEDAKVEAAEEKLAADTVTTPAVVYSGATIYVDGITHKVTKNSTFPKGNPVFRLLSVSANDIEIALVAGEFTSSGGDGTFLDKGDMVSLVNASEQITYRVKFLRPTTSETGVTF